MEDQVKDEVKVEETEVETWAKKMEEQFQEHKKKQEELIDKIVPPHKKVSRPVTDADVERVIDEAYTLRDLCFVSTGLYASAYAMAHPQIDDRDPLRFFVLNTGVMVINPKILNHTKHPVDSDEGCMTYPSQDKKTVQRFHKIEVEFQSIDADTKKLTTPLVENLSGREAKIFQHEIAHLNGHYCFDEDFTPDHALETN